jgi:Tol biopolymer transport system component
MALARGTRIGTYEIVGLLGAGGMGEVYRARDTRLGREVAIKVLANRVTEDQILLARIEREARILASLNHPSIATIHSVEDWEGAPAIVMEMIEGETLAVKLFEGPLPPAEVVRIAKQVSDALCAAHDRGIVHRDLKPANIHIRPDGGVKVLDFGLAKSIAAGDTQAQVGHTVTTTGSIMGTAPYMSPEQARGQDVDRRSDIWSFGCTVYEMLTGRRAFYGPTPADTIVAVLSAEPDWSALPADTPDGLRALLQRCLQKDVRHRLRDLGDASFEYGATNPAFVGAIAAVRRRTIWRRAFSTIPVLIVAALVWYAMTLVNRNASGVDAPLRKFEVPAEGLGDEPGTFAGETGPGAGVLISPDGRRIVYPASGRLWVRELSALASRPLAGTEKAVAPTWSPDSSWVAYFVGDELRKAPISGGSAVRIATMPGVVVEAGGAGWGADDVLYITTGNGPLWRVSSDGGDPVRVVDVEPGVLDYHDAVIGAGRPLMIAHHTNNQHSIDIIEDGERRMLFGPVPQVIRHAAYSSSGHIVYQRVDANPGIWAMQVEPRTLRPRAEPFLVAAGGLRPSVASDGTLVYVSDEKWGLVRLSFLDRTGKVVSDVGDERRGLRQPALSPQGDRIVVVAPSDKSDDLWTIDIASGIMRQLTFTGVRGDPAWNPTGTRIAFSCGASGREGGVCAVSPDQHVEPVLIMPGGSQPDFSPDGQSLGYILLDPKTRTDVWTSVLGGGAAARLIRQSPAFDFSPKISPDGHFIAYGSSELGRPEVFVADYPVPRRRVQVSTGAGAQPAWNPRGGELFYVDGGGRLNVVALDASGRSGKPQQLFAESTARARLTQGYAPSADGQRFLVVRDVDRGTTRPKITVVENWFAEFAPRR